MFGGQRANLLHDNAEQVEYVLLAVLTILVAVSLDSEAFGLVELRR